jgi:hypothetical protein
MIPRRTLSMKERSVVIEKDFNFKHAGKFHATLDTYESAFDLALDNQERKIRAGGWNKPETGQCWCSVDSEEEAYELLQTGYEAAIEKLEEAIKIDNKKHQESKCISFKNNIVGFAPIVPLAMKGVPNSMIDMRMKPIKAKVLNIAYDMSVPCAWSADDIMRNGQKMLGVIMQLERMGYRINLYATQNYSDMNGGDFLCVKIKSANRPFDLKRMSYPLMHPAFFRVCGFDWYGKAPHTTYRDCYGHDYTRDLNAEECKELVKELFGENTFYINGQTMLEKKWTMEDLKGVLLNEQRKVG